MKRTGKSTPSFESKLILGDVVEVLEKYNGECKFDVIIADPPYNIGKDFGNGLEKMSLPDYVKWCKKWLNLCFRFFG